jgi:hypothetical protein
MFTRVSGGWLTQWLTTLIVKLIIKYSWFPLDLNKQDANDTIALDDSSAIDKSSDDLLKEKQIKPKKKCQTTTDKLREKAAIQNYVNEVQGKNNTFLQWLWKCESKGGGCNNEGRWCYKKMVYTNN